MMRGLSPLAPAQYKYQVKRDKTQTRVYLRSCVPSWILMTKAKEKKYCDGLQFYDAFILCYMMG